MSEDSLLEIFKTLISKISVSDGISFASALFGAFFGAYSAYLLGRKGEKSALEERRFDACVKLQYTLITYINYLHNIRIQHLEEYRNIPDRALKLRVLYFEPISDRISFDSLSFLLTEGDPGVLQDISIAERKVLAVSYCLAERNNTLKEFYQKHDQEFQKLDIETGSCSILTSPTDLKMMTDLTNILYHCVDSAIKDSEESSTRFYKAVKTRFPKKKFIKINA